MGESERANVLRTRLLNEYKDSSLRPDVSFHIARSFEERAEYGEAARLFENFSKDYPRDKRSRDALYNAAVFYAGVGQVKKSTKLRESYLKGYGKQKGGEKEAADIYWSIAQDLERGSNHKLAAKRYEEFAKKFSGDERMWEALWREAQILRDHLRNRRGAEKIESQIFGIYRSRKKKGKNPPAIAADYASRIALDRLEPEYKKYTKLRVSRPNIKNPKKFKKEIAKKAQASRANREALHGDRHQLPAGLFHDRCPLSDRAVSWDHFVTTLTSVPCPRGLTPEVWRGPSNSSSSRKSTRPDSRPSRPMKPALASRTSSTPSRLTPRSASRLSKSAAVIRRSSNGKRRSDRPQRELDVERKRAHSAAPRIRRRRAV